MENKRGVRHEGIVGKRCPDGGRGCRTGRHERSESCTERGEAENGAITWLMSRGGEYRRAKGSNSMQKPRNSWSGSISRKIGEP